ncbi:MAG: HAMP domain-containing histidine kinase [Ktedonobacterales bacterium]|nr:HAMP domain-containing histidine kinase [Ktedonobacterales bacterium]
MYDAPLFTQREQQILRDYDRQRRLRLANGIATSMGAIILAAVLFIIVSLDIRSQSAGHMPAASDPTWSILAMTVGIGALLGVAIYAARRNQADVAAGAVVAAIVAGSVAYLLLTNHEHVMGPQTYLGILGMTGVLVSVGYLGSMRALLAATVLVNAVTALTLMMGRPFPATNATVAAFFQTQGLTENTFLVLDHATALKMVPALIILQWTLVGLIIAGSNTYRHALTDLSNVQVALQRAHQLEEMKNQFITTVNHELRNPVMRMQIYVELLRLKGQEIDEAKRTDLILEASNAGKALIKLISNILDVRRIDQDASNLVLAAIPLHQTVLNAAALVALGDGESAARPLQVDIPDQLTVWGDETRLQQILTNLISNATKYSPPATPIEIAATIVAPERGRSRQGVPPMVEITVRDHGLGIPPEEAPVLFQRFARLARDLASNVVGSGLGLFLCRVYAESMGGQIWVESTGIEGDGSTFHLTIPAETRMHATAANHP